MADETRETKVKHWRARAEHYRALAVKTRSRQNRETYDDLARNCEEVAKRLEKAAEPN